MTSSNGAPIAKGERILAFMALGIAAISFIALLVLLATPLLGIEVDATNPIWPTLLFVTYLGFPVAFLLILSLIIWRIVANRRSRGRSES
ncbi:hypothetical protein [Pseudoclavibacter helvolus]|uniref:hypothetical protein n=1 Tax=Pseudoclavibacter helvolus TaxID=255205 RepID=UPI003C776F6A